MLAPRTIAVIGASRNPANLGRRVFDHLLQGGFHGRVYAVNPSTAEIAGQPCYPSLSAVPDPIDMAVIATPRQVVLQAIDECAAAGTRAVVVISAGFAETDAEGRRLQQELLARVRGHGMRMVGPNCMGIVNASRDVRMNASFAARLPPEGRLMIASQSGGIGLALLELASARTIGISTFVSLGNKADVSGNDLLLWGEHDPQSTVLLLYLESFGNPRRFGQLARRIGRRKPIVVVKAGRTRSGSRAAGSHTAGLASNETAVASLFSQSGIIRADTIDQMFDVAQCLDLQPLPAGDRVAIVTNTGGPGILAADACEAAGLTVVPLDPATRSRLAAVMSPHASAGNPVDMVASAGAADYERIIPILLASPEVDSLLVMYTPIDPEATPATLAAIGRGVAAARAAGIAAKTVVACTLSVAAQPAPIPAGEETIPAYMFPENAAIALGRATSYAAWRRQPDAGVEPCVDGDGAESRRLCQAAAASRGDTWLSHDELRQLLASAGLTLVGEAARTADEAVEAARRAGFPVALKIDARRIVHKTEAGGVRIGLDDEDALRAACADFAARFPELSDPGGEARLIVQPMIRGVETLVGMVEDATFGPLIAFGLGGVQAEVLHDVALRLAPLSEADVDALVHGVRSFPLLQAFRGRPAADVSALKAILQRISWLACAVPELRELDLNPVLVRPAGEGCAIVDARARVAAL